MGTRIGGGVAARMMGVETRGACTYCAGREAVRRTTVSSTTRLRRLGRLAKTTSSSHLGRAAVVSSAPADDGVERHTAEETHSFRPIC